jgi:hypothetical protein
MPQRILIEIQTIFPQPVITSQILATCHRIENMTNNARSNKTFINFNNVLELKGFEFYNSQLPTGKKENLNRS